MPDQRHISTRFALPVQRPRVDGMGPFLRRLGQLIGLIVLLLVGGTVGFVLTEDTSVWQGFAWTLDTIATIGSIPSPEDTAAQVLKAGLRPSQTRFSRPQLPSSAEARRASTSWGESGSTTSSARGWGRR